MEKEQKLTANHANGANREPESLASFAPFAVQGDPEDLTANHANSANLEPGSLASFAPFAVQGDPEDLTANHANSANLEPGSLASFAPFAVDGDPEGLTADRANDANLERESLALFAPFAVEIGRPEMSQMSVREHGHLLYPGESYKIMGACFAVYNELGAGFLEAVYHEVLSFEFAERGIPYVARQPQSISYKGQVLRQGYAVDFMVYDKIVLEIKACTDLCDEHRAQAMNYLKAGSMDLGLLVNFGSYPKLQYQRIVCTEGKYQS